MSGPATCAEVDERLEALALGLVEEPIRSSLLSHVASCERCAVALSDVSRVADQLLVVAPSIEPPAGFEGATLARMGVEPDGQLGARRRSRRLWLVGVASIAAAVVLVVVVAAGPWSGTTGAGARQAEIVTAAGSTVGSVELADGRTPHVLVTLHDPDLGDGATVRCELDTSDGRQVVVGSWNYAQLEATGGVWAAAIDSNLTDAPTMRIVADDGTVLATAHLS